MQPEPKEAIEEAWRLQESIRKQRQQIKKDEQRLRDLMDLLGMLNVTRIGPYERRQKIQRRRSIVSERFQQRWPELFNRLAKITIKDASTVLDPGQVDELCEVQETETWEIISYKKPWEV